MKEKGGCSRQPAAELGLRRGGGISFAGAEEEMKLCSQLSFFPGWRGLWAPRESLLILYVSHSVP